MFFLSVFGCCISCAYSSAMRSSYSLEILLGYQRIMHFMTDSLLNMMKQSILVVCDIYFICSLIIFCTSCLWQLMLFPGDLFQLECSEFEGELNSQVNACISGCVVATHSIR